MSDIAGLVADHLDLWTSAIERKSGAGRGGGKRISLYGIERLRALILDLAVRGKLVPQDAGDENAEVLLTRLAKEKAAFTPARKSRQSTAGTEDTATFMDASVPNGWKVTTLSQIASIHRGVTYGKSDASGIERPGLIALLRGHNIQSEINLENLVYVPTSKVSLDQILKTGDIVIAMSSGSADLVGKAAQFRDEQEVSFGAFCGVIRPVSQAIQTYLAFFCQTPFYRNQTQKGGKGIGIQNLSKGDLERLACPLPPLAEQRRIVAKVDELMALCDALEGESAGALAAHQALVEELLATLVEAESAADLAVQWARLESHFDTIFTTPASIDAIKQTILDLAVRGKLVEQDESGGRSFQPLRKIIGPMDSGWSPACHSYPAQTDDAWGVLKTTAVQFLSYVEHENKELPAKLMPRPEAECQPGDILITRAGPTNRVGICCFVPETRSKLMISDKIIRFQPASKDVDGAYLALALSVGPAAAQIEVAKSGMAASQVNISQAKLREVLVPVPPLAEQRRIVAKVDALMALCDALKARLADSAETQRHLADAITQRAAA